MDETSNAFSTERRAREMRPRSPSPGVEMALEGVLPI